MVAQCPPKKKKNILDIWYQGKIEYDPTKPIKLPDLDTRLIYLLGNPNEIKILYKAIVELLSRGKVRDFFNKHLPLISDRMNDLCSFLNNSDGPHDGTSRTAQILLQRYEFLKELVEKVKEKLAEIKMGSTQEVREE